MKAQLKMTESIGVLIVFFFLIIIGFMFYTQFQTAAIQEKKQELTAQRALQIAQIASNLPEIQCSFGAEEVVVKGVCLDLLKLKTFQNFETLFYYDLLFYSNISVRILYPGSLPSHVEEIVESPIYENVPEEFTSKIRIYFPVLVRDVAANPPGSQFYFAVLTVDVYSR